jgi:hypothetical protein
MSFALETVVCIQNTIIATVRKMVTYNMYWQFMIAVGKVILMANDICNKCIASGKGFAKFNVANVA